MGFALRARGGSRRGGWSSWLDDLLRDMGFALRARGGSLSFNGRAAQLSCRVERGLNRGEAELDSDPTVRLGVGAGFDAQHISPCLGNGENGRIVVVLLLYLPSP